MAACSAQNQPLRVRAAVAHVPWEGGVESVLGGRSALTDSLHLAAQVDGSQVLEASEQSAAEAKRIEPPAESIKVSGWLASQLAEWLAG